MVDNVASAPAMGPVDQEQEVPTLAEAKNARLKDRLDELKAEECDLLPENMELGRHAEGRRCTEEGQLVEDRRHRHGGQIDTRLSVQGRMAASGKAPAPARTAAEASAAAAATTAAEPYDSKWGTTVSVQA